jgi:hypothetical protein
MGLSYIRSVYIDMGGSASLLAPSLTGAEGREKIIEKHRRQASDRLKSSPERGGGMP